MNEKEIQNIASANRLLERRPDEDYIDELTRLIVKEKESMEMTAEMSLLIFRLYREWLAISTHVLHEVAQSRIIHKIPHRSGHVLMGLVNLRGQLRLSIALHNLLQIETATPEQIIPIQIGRKSSYQRMLSVQQGEDQWIFPVDEVFGIYHCTTKQILNVPVTVAKSTANYLKGVINWENRNIGYLDEELIFHSLKRSAL
jgi:chemotaxis-related protein WspD